MNAPTRASDVAYHELRDRIVDLRLPPGHPVNEIAVAAELGLSRMPVHEAVGRLAVERFITVLPRRGSVVTALELPDVLDLFSAREALECGIAHLAARRATDADLARLRELVETADGARDPSDHLQFLIEDYEVHAFLVAIVRSPLLWDLAERLLLHNLRFWRSYWSTQPVHQTALISHHEMLLALESRDPDAAEEAMRAHIAGSRQLLQASFS